MDDVADLLREVLPLLLRQRAAAWGARVTFALLAGGLLVVAGLGSAIVADLVRSTDALLVGLALLPFVLALGRAAPLAAFLTAQETPRSPSWYFLLDRAIAAVPRLALLHVPVVLAVLLAALGASSLAGLVPALVLFLGQGLLLPFAGPLLVARKQPLGATLAEAISLASRSPSLALATFVTPWCLVALGAGPLIFGLPFADAVAGQRASAFLARAVFVASVALAVHVGPALQVASTRIASRRARALAPSRRRQP